MSEISEKDYLSARKLVADYELQQADKKLAIYAGCCKDDIFSNNFTDHRNNKATAFWVTKLKEIPDRNPDGVITYDTLAEFYTLENSHVPYKEYDDAYKNMIKTFKRKGLIQ